MRVKGLQFASSGRKKLHWTPQEDLWLSPPEGTVKDLWVLAELSWNWKQKNNQKKRKREKVDSVSSSRKLLLKDDTKLISLESSFSSFLQPRGDENRSSSLIAEEFAETRARENKKNTARARVEKLSSARRWVHGPASFPLQSVEDVKWKSAGAPEGFSALHSTRFRLDSTKRNELGSRVYY